jgi:hypothetical protein
MLFCYMYLCYLCMFSHVLLCYVCPLFWFYKIKWVKELYIPGISCSMLYLYIYASDFKQKLLTYKTGDLLIKVQFIWNCLLLDKKNVTFNTGDCLIEVTAWAGMTVLGPDFHIHTCSRGHSCSIICEANG